MSKKRKDECLFCGSRKCHTRIYRRDIPIYDEVACPKHANELEKHSDKTLGIKNGVYRNHLSGSRTYKRGEIYDWELKESGENE
jgi:hypothetical protein